MKNLFKNKSIIILGGTGSFGKNFVHSCLKKNSFRRIIIFSRDEYKQYEMKKKFSHKSLRYFLGDIRDQERLNFAFKNVDFVVNAAALKQVPAAEYNPIEFVKTNIIGSQNIINAALSNNVKKVISLSTDKAAAPVNLYGATKLCSEKLFVSANNISGGTLTKFCCVRYGNVLGSRGSVLPLFIKQKNEKYFTITNPNMTRFNIMMNEAINIVFYALSKKIDGEIFIPKLKSFKVTDLAKAIDNKKRNKYVGIRFGEKLHEELITKEESKYAYYNGKCYIL